MDQRLASALRRNGNIVTTSDLGRAQLSNAVRRGVLVRLHPGTYVATAHLEGLSPAGQHQVRCKAALCYAGPAAVISHVSALDMWDLAAGFATPVHVTVPRGSRLTSSPVLSVHYRTGRVDGVPRRGLSVSPAPQAIVDAWPALDAAQRIGIALDALNRGEVTVLQLQTRVAAEPRLRGRRELCRILELFSAGCRSPLEIWGAAKVFTGPVLRHLERQVRVRAGGHVYYLDLFHRLSNVAFELDGAAFHGSKVQRERDLRRDADLATVGILVVRFSYDRLMSDPDGVREQALTIIRSRLNMIQ